MLEGVASSAAARGVGGVVTPLAVWSGFWILSAALFLLPANRMATSVSSSITGMASGEPPWYATFLNHVGNWFGSAGVTQTWLLAVLSLVIGVGPLLLRSDRALPRPRFRRVDRILADGPGPRWDLDGIRNGPEHRTLGGAAGVGHGASRRS